MSEDRESIFRRFIAEPLIPTQTRIAEEAAADSISVDTLRRARDRMADNDIGSARYSAPVHWVNPAHTWANELEPFIENTTSVSNIIETIKNNLPRTKWDDLMREFTKLQGEVDEE